MYMPEKGIYTYIGVAENIKCYRPKKHTDVNKTSSMSCHAMSDKQHHFHGMIIIDSMMSQIGHFDNMS